MSELSSLQASPRDDAGGSVEPSGPVVRAYTTELARAAGASALAGDAVAARCSGEPGASPVVGPVVDGLSLVSAASVVSQFYLVIG